MSFRSSGFLARTVDMDGWAAGVENGGRTAGKMASVTVVTHIFRTEIMP